MNKYVLEFYQFYADPVNRPLIIKWLVFAVVFSFVLIFFFGLLVYLFGVSLQPFGSVLGVYSSCGECCYLYNSDGVYFGNL